MAKSFKSLKDPKLHLLDKLPFGKYKDCRIIDLFPDNWEYLKWLIQNTQIAFGQDVLDKITYYFNLDASYTHYVEEEAPWLQEDREIEVKDLFWKPSKSKQDWMRDHDRPMSDFLDPLLDDDIPF